MQHCHKYVQWAILQFSKHFQLIFDNSNVNKRQTNKTNFSTNILFYSLPDHSHILVLRAGYFILFFPARSPPHMVNFFLQTFQNYQNFSCSSSSERCHFGIYSCCTKRNSSALLLHASKTFSNVKLFSIFFTNFLGNLIFATKIRTMMLKQVSWTWSRRSLVGSVLAY